MNTFRTPAHTRKGQTTPQFKSPPVSDPSKINEFAVHKAKALKLVASIERAGHETIAVRLKMIQRTIPLTPSQSIEVREELKWRIKQVRELTRIMDNAQRQIDLQMGKVKAPLEARTGLAVPGPQGQTFKALRARSGPLPGTMESMEQSLTERDGDGRPGTNHVRHIMSAHPNAKQHHSAKLNIEVTAKATWFPGTEASFSHIDAADARDEQ